MGGKIPKKQGVGNFVSKVTALVTLYSCDPVPEKQQKKDFLLQNFRIQFSRLDREGSKSAQFSWGAYETEKFTSQTGFLPIKSNGHIVFWSLPQTCEEFLCFVGKI